MKEINWGEGLKVTVIEDTRRNSETRAKANDMEFIIKCDEKFKAGDEFTFGKYKMRGIGCRHFMDGNWKSIYVVEFENLEVIR